MHTGERARCPLSKNPTPRFEFSDQRSHCSYFTKWLLYRTLTVVFHDFPGPFLCASSRTFQVHLYPFFMSFQERLIEITPATFEQHSTAYSKISCPTLTANRRESSQDAIESKSSNADKCWQLFGNHFCEIFSILEKNVYKGQNTYMGQKCGNHSFSMTFHNFPGPRHDSMTFQAWKIWILNYMTFHNFPGSVRTLC